MYYSNMEQMKIEIWFLRIEWHIQITNQIVKFFLPYHFGNTFQHHLAEEIWWSDMELQPKNLASNDRKIDISSKCQEYSIHCWSLASGAKNWEIFWAENWSLWALLTDTPLQILIILISDYKEYPLGHSNWSLHFFSQVRRKNRQHRELEKVFWDLNRTCW